MEYLETGMDINHLSNINVPNSYSFPLLATGSNYASEASSADESYLIVPSTVSFLSLGGRSFDDEDRYLSWSPERTNPETDLLEAEPLRISA